MPNDGIPPSTAQSPKIDRSKANDFIRRGKLLVLDGGLSVEQIDVLYALDQDVQAAVTKAVAALDVHDAIAAIPAIYWLAGNYPGVPAEAIAAGIPAAKLKQVRHFRYEALRHTTGILYGADADGLRSLPYARYLDTEHWQYVRMAALDRSGHACQVCKSRGDLHVHHNSYERWGEELDSDVIVLCGDCHQLFHANGKAER